MAAALAGGYYLIKLKHNNSRQQAIPSTHWTSHRDATICNLGQLALCVCVTLSIKFQIVPAPLNWLLVVSCTMRVLHAQLAQRLSAAHEVVLGALTLKPILVAWRIAHFLSVLCVEVIVEVLVRIWKKLCFCHGSYALSRSSIILVALWKRCQSPCPCAALVGRCPICSSPLRCSRNPHIFHHNWADRAIRFWFGLKLPLVQPLSANLSESRSELYFTVKWCLHYSATVCTAHTPAARVRAL